MGKSITFRVIGPAALDILLSVRDGLFDNPVDPGEARAFLDDPANVLLLAFDGTEAVGMVTATVLRHPDKPPALFINEVGVRDAWQRRGIAREMMRRIVAVGRERGCRGGIWVGTEPGNEAALALYRGAGGVDLPFVGFGWDDAF